MKGTEPRSLYRHRPTPHADFDNYADKGTLRRVLVTEQRGLCCYCMGRITSDPATMKIEHWRSRAGFPDDQLRYWNLLAACNGSEGRRRAEQHCDTYKGDRPLCFNLANPNHAVEHRITYGSDGMIHSEYEEFDQQLNRVLNLNVASLKNARKAKLDGVLRTLGQAKQPISRRLIEGMINVELPAHGALPQYCQVAVYWLQRKLDQP